MPHDSNPPASFETMTKHEQLIRHIEALEPGTRISVRGIARDKEVSEGTAYKAIKEAEELGIVATKKRIGTVRVHKSRRVSLEGLTFGDVADIVEGQLLGGAGGLQRTLHKFVIGAMELDAMLRYINEDSLLIVGNREEAHRLALEQGAGVLITGGFDTSPAVKRLADARGLPIIVSRHDTFTVASMINRAMYDRLIKQKIVLIEDIMSFGRPADVLKHGDTAADFHRLAGLTGSFRFPVLDDRGRVSGMMTAKDAAGSEPDNPVERLMTRHPITAAPNITVTSAAHTMAAEGIDLLPVVDRHRRLLGVITRQEVLEAMRITGRQGESGETFDDLIVAGFKPAEGGAGGFRYKGVAAAQMSGTPGTVSEGVLSTLMLQAARRMVRESGRSDHMIESMTTYFIRPVPIDAELTLEPTVLELSRKTAKLEIQLSDSVGAAAKAILSMQLMDG
ncbi:hypothetical protein CGZ75_00555 [Paenibacillus herberti]|uniref:CBS domain-containing protein n=2 Tax=Paenibacillus herberti TaxID=1619309 RepID=A0A229P5K8_9BACL|nr:DRTGG domain-containing protein [Paenibacillus herberti]OXM17408.1 hypothetical protein CGZ75_00555 [Paenibacillus herberti]